MLLREAVIAIGNDDTFCDSDKTGPKQRHSYIAI